MERRVLLFGTSSHHQLPNAKTVGALAFMLYAEVEKFANLYRAHEDYLAAQDITYEALISAAGIISAQKQVSDDAAAYYRGISQSEYETARTRLMTVFASLSSQLNKAERDRQYAELLGTSEWLPWCAHQGRTGTNDREVVLRFQTTVLDWR